MERDARRTFKGSLRQVPGGHSRAQAVALESRMLLSVVLFNDDFNLPVGAQPATSTWHYRNGTDPNNSNVQYTNTPSTLHVVSNAGAQDGKALAMTLSPNPSSPGKFLSAEIQTNIDPVAGQLLYGHIEARIKLPGGPNGQGQGIWPAFWMLGSNYPQVGWPTSGEIDIMENKGSTPGQVQGTIHGPGYSGGAGITAHYDLPAGQTFYSGYHTFAVDWAPNWIAFSVDGHVYATRTPANLPAGTSWAFNHPFYVILDVAEGGAFVGPAGANSIYPQTMLVDYVRAYAYRPAVSGALPAGWSDQDIGAPAVAGTAGCSGGTFTVAGGGQDVWNTSDQFNFASRTVTGDVTIVARVDGLTNTADFAKAGVMVRDGTSADASYAFMFVEPPDGAPFEGASFEYRAGAGTASRGSGTAPGITAPQWVKLVRSGATFTAYDSADGNGWAQVGSAQMIGMSQTVDVGLAVDANNDAAIDTATFSDVQVIVPDAPPTVVAAAFKDARPQPTISFTFDKDVSMSLSAASLQVQGVAGGASPAWSAPSYDLVSNTATFTFMSSLADGNYRATLVSARVADAAGTHLAQDDAIDFFVLSGDVNHDRTVDFNDLLILAQNYGKTGAFMDGDLTRDRTVDFNDLLLLAQNYGHGIPLPTA